MMGRAPMCAEALFRFLVSHPGAWRMVELDERMRAEGWTNADGALARLERDGVVQVQRRPGWTKVRALPIAHHPRTP